MRALKHRNYRLYFAGQLISTPGTWMQSTAQAWLVYRLTKSTTALGLISFVEQIPFLLLAVVGGVMADRYIRRRIIIFTQSAAMIHSLILAILTLTGYVEVWMVFVLAVLVGTVNAIDVPARQSFLVEIVGEDDLTNAIALNSLLFNTARIVGPTMGGLLIAAIGEGWCFFINTLSYLAVIAGLLLMKGYTGGTTANSKLAPVELTKGFHYIWRIRPVRALLLLVGLVSLTGIPFIVLMPVFSDHLLGGGPKILGWLLGAVGVGALAGASALLLRHKTQGASQWIAVALASVSFGVSLILFSLSHTFELSLVLLAISGFSTTIQMVLSNALIQTIIANELRGRVMALYSTMLMGIAPLGALLAGFVAEHLGVRLTVASGGAICIAGGLLCSLRLPSILREVQQLLDKSLTEA